MDAVKVNKNYLFLQKYVPDNRIVLLQGGTRSGKTYSVLYYIIWLCKNYSGMLIDCVRDTNVAAKGILFKDFIDILKMHNIFNPDCVKKGEQEYHLNGNTIAFYGCDMTTKIYGRKRDILFVNEAQLVSEEVIDQLFPRTTHRIICDFNPALYTGHWLFRYVNAADVPKIITTYKDNPFLSPSQIAEIESRKDNYYWWSVYGNGEIMLPAGTVFRDWTLGSFPTDLSFTYGADFGFVKDPTTLVRVAVDKREKKIYCSVDLYDEGYLRGTEDIFKAFSKKAKDSLIVADAHGQQQRMIYDLARMGLNIVECRNDGVMDGVMEMLNYQIVVSGDYANKMIDELTRYSWADKGKTIITDAFNHAIDAMRYAFMYAGYGSKYSGEYMAVCR